MLRRRWLLGISVALAVSVCVRPQASAGRPRLLAPVAHAAAIPAQLSDQEFRTLSADLSEPPGSFRSENLVSNETMFQWVIPDLVKTVKPGGVYLGVAPDQNFTYIVALRPKIALIVDIRRGNVLEHLLYKAIIEMSADRVEFLTRLFSCEKPKGIAGSGADMSARELLTPFYSASRQAKLFEANETVVLDWIEKKHGFPLSAADEEQLRWIYGGFYTDGPALTYASYQGLLPQGRAGLGRDGIVYFPGGRGGMAGAYAGYGDLQAQTDAQGENHAYLASEASFQWLKAFETKNLIVPFTGDFAGTKAIRAAGAWVRDHGATITAVYTSNVEQYLFQQGDDWSRYYKNIATLPLDDTSTFIRSIPSMMVMPNQPGARAASMLCSMTELVTQFKAGTIGGYGDVAGLCRQAVGK